MTDLIAIGVDIGGTTIAAGAVSSAGEVIAEELAPTHQHGPGTARDTIAELIDRVRRRTESLGHAPSGIGLGVPGIVDAVHGIVGQEIPHVPELAGQPIGADLAARFGLPAFVENDVNALALAEWRFGAGRGSTSLVVLAPGTGFGCGIVLDGRLIRGFQGFGGEFGHTPVKFDGRPCWCGGRGCLAVYSSGRGIAEAARDRVASDPGSPLLRAAGGETTAITAPLVFRAAADGDRVAGEIVDEACRALGAMVAIIVNGLNPEVVVVTGGVAASFLPLDRRVLAAAADHAFARALAATRVVFVPGDKRVTMRGAAALVFYELERRMRDVAV